MVEQKHLYKVMKRNSTLQTPSTHQGRWRFAGLSAAELLPLLQRHLITQDANAQWQLVWLNDNGKSVIGLLPKVSWIAYACSSQDASTSPPFPKDKTTYQIIKTCRDDRSHVSNNMSYTDWQDELIAYSNAYKNSADIINLINDQPHYYHGLIGFIGYDIAAYELSPTAIMQQASQPCAVLGHYDIYLTPTHVDVNDDDTNNTVITHNEAISWQLNVQSPAINSEDQATDTLSALIAHLDKLDNELSNRNTNNKISLESQSKLTPLKLTAQWNKDDYQRAFAQTQYYLQQGDCYQINLTQAWQGYINNSAHNYKTTPVLIDYLPSLQQNTQAPFAGYLGVNGLKNNSENGHSKTDSLNSVGFELLSCSPELFFTFIKDRQTGQNYIRTKPIKGTMPRSIDATQDAALKQQLIDSDKDRAENVMIVDLLRNDLGKYAKVGSVKVPQLFAIESFSNVHHMVSTITAELKADTHPLAVLFGSLPAGSITGTPKKRAVEIISELEATPRGAYCGTLGYMNFDGSGQWNVLIRTLQAGMNADDEKQVSLWAGGGITIASDCASEYQECLDKVGNLLQVLVQGAGLK